MLLLLIGACFDIGGGGQVHGASIQSFLWILVRSESLSKSGDPSSGSFSKSRDLPELIAVRDLVGEFSSD